MFVFKLFFILFLITYYFKKFYIVIKINCAKEYENRMKIFFKNIFKTISILTKEYYHLDPDHFLIFSTH